MEAAKGKVMGQLSNLSIEQLKTICGTENIQIPPSKLNRRSSIENLVLLFLSSAEVEDSEDEGLELFTRLGVQIDGMLGITNTTVKVETAMVSDTGAGEKGTLKSSNIVSDANSSNKSEASGSSEGVVRSRVTHRMKDFKIEGKIGHGESPLSYHNIQYQVRDGEDLEYTWKEIQSALIKAMKAGSSIRDHFEDNRETYDTKDKFMQMLESLIDEEEKDSAKLLTEMSSKVQGVREKVQTYVLDMINLRKRILKMAVEEGNPLSEVLVRKWCTHAILVGLRLDPIRTEMRVILKDPMIEEHEVMKKVKELVKMEKEHLEKMGEDEDDEEEENSTKNKNSNRSNNNAGKKNCDVNHINASEGWPNTGIVVVRKALESVLQVKQENWKSMPRS